VQSFTVNINFYIRQIVDFIHLDMNIVAIELHYSTANIRLVGPILCSKLGYFEMLKTLLIDPINTRGTVPYMRLMYGITFT